MSSRSNTLNLRVALLAAAVAALLALTFSSGTETRLAEAAGCNDACLSIDAIPGGGVDDFTNVSGNFSVDIVADNTNDDDGIAAFDFIVVYNRLLLSAAPPVALVGGGWNCDLIPPSGDLPEEDPNTDGNPVTGEARLACFIEAVGTEGLPDGPIARIDFTLINSGSSNLHLTHVVAGNPDGIPLVDCEPVGDGPLYGGCEDAAVATTGAPPPPPPPPPGGGGTCAVRFALDGETVLCTDGSRVRFIGVGSPLGMEPGAAWATAVTNWFLAGRTITLETDVEKFDQFGSRWAYPHYLGSDGADYNISAVLIFVGMARHYREGPNATHIDWFNAAQNYARVACWNMWDGGNPWAFESGCQ